MPYFVSFGHLEHLLALVFVAIYMITSIRGSFQSTCYNLEASAFRAFIAYFEGVLQSLGFSLISACYNWGRDSTHDSEREIILQGGETHVECAFILEIAFV
jgi:hypothetical protein